MNNVIRPEKEWTVERLRVRQYQGRPELGAGAASDVAARLRALQQRQEYVRMIFAAAPSQNEFLQALVAEPGIRWDKVIAFHLDEYVGLPEGAPQTFRHYLQEHIFSQVPVPFAQINLINGHVRAGGEQVVAGGAYGAHGAHDAHDAQAECWRYASLLVDEPADIACLGIGENGHLAFNDPPVADFLDPEVVKIVELENKCRQQQVHDGCFPTLDQVPTHAFTMTIPALMAADYLFCMVPGATKTAAIKATLTQPVSVACPATILRRHMRAVLYIDRESGAGWSQ
ncbi:MAG TPA: glucosamine-6-phosphate deaminase [Firmicutes bacterium]|nr:glucosamine-6-phosphate deaminase [Bacillota bacterium]HBG44884.1 glucosamine-6-phosphate deaminase [Bacillota bacterium]HBL67807.1 glucosamine-6-phosphate deaminase [Bacillota bacterium]HBR24927.1 glucosamine-6-phosphate deaminase [Bacillota bacterium]